jgi:hypothetical protein
VFYKKLFSHVKQGEHAAHFCFRLCLHILSNQQLAVLCFVVVQYNRISNTSDTAQNDPFGHKSTTAQNDAF